MANKKITIGLDFDVNLAQLNALKEQLNEIRLPALTQKNVSTELKDAGDAAKFLKEALEDAWNPKLGQLDLSKLNKSIKDTYGNIGNLRKSLGGAGDLGIQSFNNFTNSVFKTNTQIKQTNKLLNSMATSMANTVKWGITSSIFNNITGSIQKAWDYSLKLDSSLNDIRIVTGKSADEMERFARVANTSAKDLRASTLDYTEAALIYYQQGLGEADVKARTETTLKVANVTGQTGQAVSEQLTAVWNGYKVAAEESELYIDKLSAVAATTAADLEELSTGMSKVASAANAMGVDVDQLNAQLATIISVTRQAPESVGTALKTIYARMGDIEAGITDDGVTLGDYTEKMAEMGVHVLNAKGELRDMGEVIEEVGNNWNNFSREQQIALAQTMAGTRQYNNLIALFDSWEMYEDALDSSKNSAGELQRQQDIYMESTEAHLQQLATEAEKAYDILFDDSAVKTMTSALTTMLGVVNSFMAGLGGGLSTLSYLGLSTANLFSSQIGGFVAQKKYNKAVDFENESQVELKNALAAEYYNNNYGIPRDEVLNSQLEDYKRILEVSKAIGEEDYKQLQDSFLKKGVLEEEKRYLQDYLDDYKTLYNMAKESGYNLEGVNIGAERLKPEQYQRSINIFQENLQNDKDTLDIYQTEGINANNFLKGLGETQNYFQGLMDGTFENDDAQNAIIKDIRQGAWTEKFNKMLKENNIIRENLSKEEQKTVNNIEKSLQKFAVFGDEEESLHLNQTIENFLNNIIPNLQSRIDIAEEKIERVKEGYEKVGKEGKVNIEEKKSEIEKDSQANQKAFQDKAKQAEDQRNTAIHIQSLTTLLNIGISLVGVYKTLTDESLSWGEKATQAFTVVAVTGMQLLMNLNSIKMSLDLMTKSMNTFAIKHNVANASMKKGFWSATKDALSANVAVMGLNMSLGTTIALGAVIVAALVAVGAAIYMVATKEERAAKQAQEDLQNISEAVENTKKAYEDLKSAVEDYEKSKEALSQLKEGTDEWNEAVQNLNSGMLDLMERYPKLAEMMTLENGVLSIDSTKYEDYLAELKKSQANAQVGKIIAQNQNVEAQQELTDKQLKADINQKDWKDTWTGIGATVGSIVGIGALIASGFFTGGASWLAAAGATAAAAGGGATVFGGVGRAGASFGANVLQGINLSEKEYNTLMTAIIETNGSVLESHESLEAIGFKDDELRDAILEHKTELLRNSETIQANTEANRIRNQQKVDAYLEGNSLIYQNIEDQEIKDAISSAMGQVDLTQMDEYDVSGNDKKIQRAYADLMGWETTDIENKAGKAIYHIKDENGKEYTQTVSDDLARNTLRENNALAALSEQTEEYKKTVEEVKALTDNKDIASGLLGMAGGKDFNANTFSPDELKELSAELERLKKEGTLEEIDWTQFGFENSEDFLEGFKNGIANYDAEAYWKNLFSTTEASVKSLDEILSKAQKGEDIEEEAFIALENKYGQYLTFLKRGSHEYLEEIRRLREVEEQTLIIAAEEQAKMAYDEIEETRKEIDNIMEEIDEAKQEGKDTSKLEIKLEGKFEELDKQIKEYSDKKKKVKVQIETDLKSDVDDAFGLAAEFNDIQELLSDDLELTFDEAQKVIADGNGAILENAQETANNTIKLNAKVKDEFIKNKQEEMKASKQQKIDELENNNKVLQSQKDLLEKEMTLLTKAVEAKSMSEKIELLARAMLIDEEYQLNVSKMKKELEANDTKNEELGTQEEKFFNSLNTMYNDDLANQDSYFAKIKQKWKDHFINLGGNVKLWWDQLQLKIDHAQGQNLSTTAEDLEAYYRDILGVDVYGDGIDKTGSGTGVTSDYQKNSETKLDEMKQKITEEIVRLQNDLENGEEFSVDKVIEARKKVIQAEIDSIEAQIGANDAGIAALRSSWESLETARKYAGTEAYQKELEKEKDLYHDINIEITKLENELKKLQKEQEKLVGQDLIDNLNTQTEALNKQADAIRRKIDINAEYEKKYLRGLLAEQGVLFDPETGDISNYDEIFDTHYKYLQELQRQEIATKNKDAKQAISNLLTQAEEDFEKMTKYMSRYDELTVNDIPNWEASYQDTLNQAIENNIQKFNMEIELRIETSEAERDWNEFKKKVIDDIDDDDILGNAKASLQDFHSYYKDGYEGIIQVNTDHVNDILFELREMDRGIESKYYGNNRQKALEDLKTYYTQLTEDLTAIDELSEEIRQSYLDMMDEAQAEFDKQIASYEQITNLIDHDLKLLELLGGEKNYKSFSHYYDAQVENNKKQLDFQRQQVEFWKEEMDNADEGSERWLKAKENLESTTIAWRELTNKSIEDVQAKYLNAIKLIFEELNNEITSGKGLEYIKEEWDLITRNSEKYLDNINAAYGIEQLRNKYQEAIDNTDSISAQEQLNDLMAKEIAALEEKDKLTEYDVERANKRYEIALKQIALEEAQQNKTSMKLKRDSQGNYSYVFTADEDAVSKAEDELADAQNALYNFDKENYLNNLDELYAAYEEYQEKMLEAAQINDPEERAQKELLINEQYGELINGLTEQNQNIRNNLYESAFEELARLQDKNAESFKNMTQTQKDALMNDLIPQWESGVQQMADKFAGEGGLEEVCKGAMEQISEATQQYKTDLEEVEETSGLAFDKIEQGTDTAIQETQDLIIENEDLIKTYEDELEAIQDVITELDTLIEKFAEAEQAAKDAAEAAYYYTRNEDYDSADAAFKDRDYSLEMTRAIVSGEDLEGEHYTSSARRREKKIGGMEVKVDNDRLDDLFAAYIAGDEKARFVVMEVYNGRANYTDEFLNKYGFNTGGYTGNWSGDEGRLALLHQKELVLNANDTQNILNAVQIIRSVEGSLLRRMSEMTSNIGNVYSIAENKETLEQNVHIEANFPNVTNSKEVENAIDNLINIAAQRTHRDIK